MFNQKDIWDYIFKKEEDYSSFTRTDRLGSLVRDKAIRECRKCPFLDLVAGKKYGYSGDLMNAVHLQVSKLLKKCSVTEESIDLTPVTQYIAPWILEQLKFEYPKFDDRSIAEYTTKTTNLLTVSFTGGSEKHFTGPLDKKLRDKWDVRVWRKWRAAGSKKVFQINLVRFFSELIVVSEYEKYYEERLKDSNLHDNVVYANAVKKDRSHFASRCEVNRELDGMELYDYFVDIGLMPVFTSEIVDRCYKPFGFTYLSKELPKLFIAGASNSIPYEILMDIVNEYEVELQREKYLKDVATDYATSYMDKKNIPQKYLDAAANSKFRTVYGHVEYDADTDLNKMASLEKEFMAVMELFNNPELSDCNLRFRKLGHHKASGLYYPAFKCMCVDIRMPHSFVHELFHLLDFKYSELSLKARFYDVRVMYEDVLTKEMSKLPDDSLVKKQLKGNTKYNLKYYLEPTEIFARCGEMYVNRILNVSNTLNEDSKDFAYPKDDKLMSLISDYYGFFFREYLGVICCDDVKCVASI